MTILKSSTEDCTPEIKELLTIGFGLRHPKLAIDCRLSGARRLKRLPKATNKKLSWRDATTKEKSQPN